MGVPIVTDEAKQADSEAKIRWILDWFALACLRWSDDKAWGKLSVQLSWENGTVRAVEPTESRTYKESHQLGNLQGPTG